MRVIAGEFRGRSLLAPPGDATRPITDRAKQSLFDILSPRVEDAIVYDCFAGAGSLGLECLSRGARHATFFETDRHALAALRKNIDSLRVQSRSTIQSGDLFAHLAKPPAAPNTITLLFLDPPYAFVRDRPAELQSLVRNLVEYHLAPAALVVFRHDAGDELALAPLARIDRRTYGTMAIELLET